MPEVRFFGKSVYAVAESWLITALRASPVRGFENSFTGETSFHLSLGVQSQGRLDRTSKARGVTFRIPEQWSHMGCAEVSCPPMHGHSENSFRQAGDIVARFECSGLGHKT